MLREKEKSIFEEYQEICEKHKFCTECELYLTEDGKHSDNCACAYFYNKGRQDAFKEMADHVEKCVNDELML